MAWTEMLGCYITVAPIEVLAKDLLGADVWLCNGGPDVLPGFPQDVVDGGGIAVESAVSVFDAR